MIEYVIKLTAEELQVVINGIVQMPFNMVASIHSKIREQVIEQEEEAKLQLIADKTKQESGKHGGC